MRDHSFGAPTPYKSTLHCCQTCQLQVCTSADNLPSSCPSRSTAYPFRGSTSTQGNPAQVWSTGSEPRATTSQTLQGHSGCVHLIPCKTIPRLPWDRKLPYRQRSNHPSCSTVCPPLGNTLFSGNSGLQQSTAVGAMEQEAESAHPTHCMSKACHRNQINLVHLENIRVCMKPTCYSSESTGNLDLHSTGIGRNTPRPSRRA